MFALISPENTQLPPGSVVRLPATWFEYQHLCDQRGDGSIPRIKYRSGEVLLMSPLPTRLGIQNLNACILTDILILRYNQVGNDFLLATPRTCDGVYILKCAVGFSSSIL